MKKRVFCLFLAILMLMSCFVGCSPKSDTDKKEFHTFDDFRDAKLGVLTGSEFDRQTKELFPDSEMLQFYDVIDLLLGLETGKIDGCLLDGAFYSAIGWEKDGYKAINSDRTTPVNYAFMLSESEMAKKILPQLDECILEMKTSGELDQLAKKWFSGTRPTEYEDYDALTGENGTITVALSDSDVPFSYISEGKARGFDVEIMIAFARRYGYKLDFKDVDFGAKLAGIESNKYDVGIGDITVTDERREEMNFTVSYYQSPVYMIIKDSDSVGSSLSDLANKKIGVVTGSIQAIMLPDLVPNAVYLEFNNYADVITAFHSNKIDAFSTDESIYKAMLWEGQKVDRIDEALSLSDYGLIFGKGENLQLQQQINEYIAKIKADGTHQTLEQKWFGDSEPAQFESYSDLSADGKVLRVGISSASKPFVYEKNGKYAGFEIEFIIGFCREYGYGVTFEDTAFSGIMAGVAAGKYDVGMSGITITDERKESMDFSDPLHTEDLVLVIHRQEGAKTFEDYKNANVGVTTGTYAAAIIHDVFPEANIKEFSSISDMLLALTQGKIDICMNDVSAYTCMKWEGMNIGRLEDPYETSEYGIAFEKGVNTEIRAQMNEFIANIRENGEYDRLHEKWFGDKEPSEFADPSALTGTNGKLKVVICNEGKPFGYIKNGKLVGYDTDFIVAFAQEYGYTLEIESVTFPGVLAGLGAGMYDLALAGLTITEERKETLDFTDPYHFEDMIFMIQGENSSSIDQFSGATLGVVTGSLYGGYSREQFPNATIKEFNTFADVLVALKQGKVAGIMLDKPNFNSVARTDKSLSCITVPAYSVEIGFGFQKNEDGYALQDQMNAFLQKLKAAGKIDELIDKWYGETEPEETIPLEELAANAKTLNVAIDTTRKPFVYMYEGKPVGFEIEVLYLFCKEYGYNVNISDISFASGLAGLAGEKYDLVCGGLYMTDERKESVNFSEPYMFAEVVMAKCERSSFDNFILSVRESFEKTFIREQRWKLIVEGICTTMIISFFAVIGGTLLGFGLYMLARSKYLWLSKLTKGIAKVYSTIIAGTPTLVVLMILFYVVFSSPDMSGIFVAIVGFVLTFGSFVYENISLTVSGVDNGQLEAAYALGYGRNMAFFRIILPQAMKMFVPAYSGEIISLIKATSVVGYIAVNDLTKMGDIIRGNTYEAFFPLIAVAVIYFAITWAVAGLLSVLRRKTEPKKRNNKNILKGVVR